MSIYLGVDQTGAVSHKGIPKVLPASVLIDNRIELFHLKSFNASELKTVSSSLQTIHAVIDCVLGLPKQLGRDLRESFQKTLEFRGYGRAPARDFFRAIGNGRLYRRACELRLNANSVFLEHPFQKNIQTGTFRFWKDLAQDPDWFYMPWIEKPARKNLTPIYEGYPTYTWKTLLGAKHRKPSDLKDLIKKFDSRIALPRGFSQAVEKDPNLADAVVLALAAREWTKTKPKPHSEGHILGDTRSKD